MRPIQKAFTTSGTLFATDLKCYEFVLDQLPWRTEGDQVLALGKLRMYPSIGLNAVTNERTKL
jgi:hypothetical protein